MEQEILDVEGLAALLKYKVRTVYNKLSKGKPMPPRINMPGSRLLRFSRASAVEWLMKHEEAKARGEVRGRGRPPR